MDSALAVNFTQVNVNSGVTPTWNYTLNESIHGSRIRAPGSRGKENKPWQKVRSDDDETN
jgi:hypothetical protein